MNERKRFLEKRFLKKYGRLNPDVAKRMSIEVIDVVVNQDNATMKYAEILKHKEEDKVIRVVHSVDLIREGDGWKIKLLSDEVIKEETLKGKLGSSDSSGL